MSTPPPYRYITLDRLRGEDGWGTSLLKRPEPHPDRTGHEPPYSCGCVTCEQWRGARVRPGRLCRPATQDPSRTTPGTVSAWPLNSWERVGWGYRLEDHKIFRVMVVGYVDELDKANGGHLDCVVVLTHEAEPRLLVTSRKWLVALA